MNTMNTFESHVAQQSRRDKLRVQQPPPPPPPPSSSTTPHHYYRSYDSPPPTMFSSDHHHVQHYGGHGEASFLSTSTSALHDGTTTWPNFITSDHQIHTNNNNNNNNNNIHIYNHLKPPPAPPQLSGGYNDELNFTSHHQQHDHQLYHTPLHDMVSASHHHQQQQTLETTGLPCSWVDGPAGELLLLPSYNTPAAAAVASVWMNRQPTAQQWYHEGDQFARIKPEGPGFTAVPPPTNVSSSSTQSLSLSLSSNPIPELQVAAFRRQDDLTVIPNSSTYQSQGTVVVGSSTAPADHRRAVTGPLGPFTGYAAILMSSKFLKPAQQLLDEFCSIATGSKTIRQCDVGSGRSSGAGSSIRCDTVVGGGGGGDHHSGTSIGRGGGNSGVSSSSYYSSTDVGGEGGANNGGSQGHRPEFQQKKAKLLYMQEEVCRRYKQYHQQMQMVVSSFESVAGLSAATPYISFALKAVSKHFRSIKNAITDQLRHVSRLLGEEFMSSPGSSRGDTTPRLKYIDQNIRKQKVGENSLNFMDNSQPVWRPQRGLPERAVAVLRAWLFDHFLHPYPTDTDKHMLASQTGLSRNQVSNWFINARVRLWKPMVEEIHMLETKGMSGMDLNSSNRNDGKPLADGGGQPSSDQMSEAQSNKLMESLDPMLDEGSSRAVEQWHREKRSRMEECGIPAGMDGSLMSFAMYPGALDVGGLGAVSLTLGLQHNEGAQQQQQQIRRHFGGHMVHDFVG